jgi:transposase-like protein
MARKRYGAEQIIGYLRQAEVMIGRGCTIEEVLREIDVTANTYYRWRKEYGGLGDGSGSPPERNWKPRMPVLKGLLLI